MPLFFLKNRFDDGVFIVSYRVISRHIASYRVISRHSSAGMFFLSIFATGTSPKRVFHKSVLFN